MTKIPTNNNGMNGEEGPLNHLIRMLAALPGLGNRSARRIALHLLGKRAAMMIPLADALKKAAEEIKECPECNNLDMIQPCNICRNPARDRSKICVVAQVSDLWALERAGVVSGLYHVLGGHLSPLDGIGPERLNIGKLIERAAPPVKEVLLALNATVEGQSTAHYLTEQLQGRGVTVTRLAQGVPIGGELDYLDEGTLAAAIKARRTL